MDTNDDKYHVAVQKRKDSHYTNVAELIEHPYRKKWTSTPTSYYTQKPTLDVIDLCMKWKTIKLLEENMGDYFGVNKKILK